MSESIDSLVQHVAAKHRGFADIHMNRKTHDQWWRETNIAGATYGPGGGIVAAYGCRIHIDDSIPDWTVRPVSALD